LVFTPAVSLEINFECHIYHVTLNNIEDVIGKKCVLPMHNYVVNIFINVGVSYILIIFVAENIIFKNTYFCYNL